MTIAEEETSTRSVGAATAWRTGFTAAGIALAASLVVLLVARLSGADMVARPPQTDATTTIGVLSVAVVTVVATLVGSLLLVLLRRRGGARAWLALAWIGLAVGVLTTPAPLTVDATAGTRVALACMHVLTGLVWLVVVRRAARGSEH